MSEHPRAHDGAAEERLRDDEDELVRQITRSLHAHARTAPDPAVVTARAEAALARGADRHARTGPADGAATVSTLARRGGKAVLVGALASGLVVAGAGAAAAAAPYSGVARVVEDVAQAVGIDWSAMPEGYTRAQYEAFWDAGYTYDDVLALDELWNTDDTETKARAGQLLLDGRAVPIPPSGGTGDDAR
ncbi:hypothetical protein GTQ99_11115 [Kineococcus sp. T13]|uniref:hypothetical protein n=1 Tax=Kineococcus vitellinus TaxID=2696565 RepID=UPI001412F75F|nr:hypothetical protein [Kineococcus vitellinus]NAZ75957.1 hypothetical protein [Kineococcus vitellinus]